MKSFTDQFISDLYGSILHVETPSLSGVDTVTTVYDGVGNASALSVGLSGVGATVTGTFTAGNIEFPSYPNLIKFIDLLYPVGSCLITLDATSPASRFLGTTWSQVGQGRVLAGVGTGTDASGVSKTITPGVNAGGSYQQTLSSGNIPDHFHYVANVVTDFSSDKDDLTPNNYLARGGRSQNSTASYNFEGNAVLPTVGRTSGVVGANQTSPIATTNPTYGVYVWTRIS
jgi:hypothetical protein